MVSSHPKGATEFSTDIDLSAEVQIPSSSENSGLFDVEVEGVGSTDTRTLTLSRGIAAKRWDAADLDRQKDEWVDKDGFMHGHTIYSYNDARLPNSNPNIQQFNAELGGKWTWKTDPEGTGDIPDVDWSWSHTGTSDTYLHSSQIMPKGKLIESPNGLIPGVKGEDGWTITYTATDKGDGTTASSDYTLTLHDPWEVELKQDVGTVYGTPIHPSNIVSSNPIYDSHNPPPPFSPKYAYSEEATATQEQSFTQSKTAGISFEAGIDASKSALGPFLSDAGIDLSVKGDAKISVASEDKKTQLNQQGFSYSSSPPMTLQPGQYTQPRIEIWLHRKIYKVRHWNESGFAGDSLVTVDTFDKFEPRWDDPKDLASGQGGPGGSGGDPS